MTEQITHTESSLEIKNLFSRVNYGTSHEVALIYNKLFNSVPHTLDARCKLDVSCLPGITDNFDKICSEKSLLEKGSIREDFSIWLGKSDTKYARTVLMTRPTTESHSNSPSIPVTRFFHSDITSKLPNKEIDGFKLVVASNNEEIVDELVKIIEPHRVVKSNSIHVLVNDFGLSITPMEMEPMITDLSLNYGDEFVNTHEKLLHSLTNDKSGLYLCYGRPGTGKSSYIRHLLQCGIDRKLVYIPIGLIDQLVSPDIIPLLMENKGMILVIEDAEKALISREDGGGNPSLVSTILNLTDGFLGTALNISVIATFNTEKDKLDEALLRKGRLKMIHEFEYLSVENAQRLVDSLKIEYVVKEPMSLADIYNIEADNELGKTALIKEEKTIGFGG